MFQAGDSKCKGPGTKMSRKEGGQGSGDGRLSRP